MRRLLRFVTEMDARAWRALAVSFLLFGGVGLVFVFGAQVLGFSGEATVERWLGPFGEAGIVIDDKLEGATLTGRQHEAAALIHQIHGEHRGLVPLPAIRAGVAPNVEDGAEQQGGNGSR